MKVLYYDCFSGISGDMNLAAMIDLGVSKDYLISELSKLKLDGYSININAGSKMGITGTRVDVLLDSDKTLHHHEDDHYHTHEHTHENEHTHEHVHEHPHIHEHEHSHEQHEHEHLHRNLNDIEQIINSSSLSDKVKKLSIEIFLKVAEAEGKVHGKPLNEVHFHEVGAVDSIVDIIGAAICFDKLKVDKVMCSHIELGGGFVKCAHGLIPVPAPATLEILKNAHVKYGAVQFETTTPTGAAILSTLVDEFTSKPDIKINKIGYGIGHRDLSIPNVLRVMLCETADEPEDENPVVIECNIDDMNPELYEYVSDKLFLNGASDVYMTPIVMKKSRPAIKLSVLSPKNKVSEVTKILFTETTTIGLRKYEISKEKLIRKEAFIDTKYGSIRIKNSYYDDKIVKSKPEYEDCKKLALSNNVPINLIYNEAVSIINIQVLE